MIEPIKDYLTPDWIVVIISTLSMIGSFFAFCMAHKEQKKAKEHAEAAAKYYESGRLSKLYDMISDDLKRNEKKSYTITIKQIPEQYPGYSEEDGFRILESMVARGILILKDDGIYVSSNDCYNLEKALEIGVFTF